MPASNSIIKFPSGKSKHKLPDDETLFYCRVDRAALAYVYYTRIDKDPDVAVQLMNKIREQEPDCVIALGEELTKKVQEMNYEKLMTVLFSKESELTN